MLTINPPNGRGCGTRDKNKTYLCHAPASKGRPIEDFILDPVIEWKGKWQRGFKIVPNSFGHNDIVIFVGEKYYRCLWDYVEETRHVGASRKVADNFPFHMLTSGKSHMLFAHRRAYWTEYFQPPMLNRNAPLENCKFFGDNLSVWTEKQLIPGEHPQIEKWSYCTFSHKDLSYYFYKDEELEFDGEGNFIVNLPSCQYQGKVPIKGHFTKDHFKPGIFLSLLLTHIEFPYEANIKVQNDANKAGYETYAVDY